MTLDSVSGITRTLVYDCRLMTLDSASGITRTLVYDCRLMTLDSVSGITRTLVYDCRLMTLESVSGITRTLVYDCRLMALDSVTCNFVSHFIHVFFIFRHGVSSSTTTGRATTYIAYVAITILLTAWVTVYVARGVLQYNNNDVPKVEKYSSEASVHEYIAIRDRLAIDDQYAGEIGANYEEDGLGRHWRTSTMSINFTTANRNTDLINNMYDIVDRNNASSQFLDRVDSSSTSKGTTVSVIERIVDETEN